MAPTQDNSRMGMPLSQFVWMLLASATRRFAPEDYELYFTADKEKIHTFFSERLKFAFRSWFPQLQNLNFAEQGAFPYSLNLTEAFATILSSGRLVRVEDAYRLRWRSDTEEFLSSALTEYLEDSDFLCEHFSAMTDTMHELVVPSPFTGNLPETVLAERKHQ